MSLYIVAPAARDDLIVIWRYYAEQAGGPDVADRKVGKIVTGFHTIANTPGIGHSRQDLSDEALRFWAVGKYLIIYRSETVPVQIVRVLHAARDVQATLRDK